MISRRASLLLFTAGLVLASVASAEWPAGGKFVMYAVNINGVRTARILDQPPGYFTVLTDGVGGNAEHLTVQRLTHGGELAPGWPAGGVGLAQVLVGTPLREQSVFVDAGGRTWRTIGHGPPALEYVDAHGILVPGPFRSFSLGGTGPLTIHATPASDGDVFVKAGARLMRITPDGVTAEGWAPNGVFMPSTYDDAVMSDGDGGVVVFLREAGLASAPTVTRIDGNASLHAGWPPSGVALSSIAPQDNLFPLDSQLLRSGATRGLAVWSIGAGSGKRRWLIQRFRLEGAVDPAWPADGLEVVAADTIVACRAIEDGSGGAYIVRQSHGRPVATHVSSSGTFIGSPDTDLLDAGALYVPTLYHLGLGLADGPHDLIADATADGGLLIGWSDTRLSPAVSFRLRWLTPALAPAPDKPAEPVVFFPGSPAPFAGCMLALKADGTHGAFVAWSDRRVQQPYPTDGVDLWMAYVALPVAVGVQAPSPAFSVSSPRPNPAIGSVVLDLVLPDDSPARIELLDIAGRVIRSQLVEGAGPHAITFNATGSLAPGLYFAHVTSRNHSTAVRVVVSR